jgi:hypothetical protein
MCDGFGCIVTKQLDVFTIEPDCFNNVSHNEIVRRLGYPFPRSYCEIPQRKWVRVECKDWTMDSFRLDEPYEWRPAWADELKEEIYCAVSKSLKSAKEATDKTRFIRRAFCGIAYKGFAIDWFLGNWLCRFARYIDDKIYQPAACRAFRRVKGYVPK